MLARTIEWSRNTDPRLLISLYDGRLIHGHRRRPASGTDEPAELDVDLVVQLDNEWAQLDQSEAAEVRHRWDRLG